MTGRGSVVLRGDVAAYTRAGHAIAAASNGQVPRRVGAALRKVAQPLADRVIRDGAAVMPRRGGLSALVAASKAQVQASASGPRVGVRLRLVAGGASLRNLDAGVVRHPVFGNRQVWKAQAVPAGAFTDAFEAGAPTVEAEVVRALEGLADDIAGASR